MGDVVSIGGGKTPSVIIDAAFAHIVDTPMVDVDAVMKRLAAFGLVRYMEDPAGDHSYSLTPAGWQSVEVMLVHVAEEALHWTASPDHRIKAVLPADDVFDEVGEWVLVRRVIDAVMGGLLPLRDTDE